MSAETAVVDRRYSAGGRRPLYSNVTRTSGLEVRSLSAKEMQVGVAGSRYQRSIDHRNKAAGEETKWKY